MRVALIAILTLVIYIGLVLAYAFVHTTVVDHHAALPAATKALPVTSPPWFAPPTASKSAPKPAPKPTVLTGPGGPTLWSKGDALWYAPGYPDKTVALTFDDGPGPSTAAIISILEQYKVPAAFFNIGKQLADYPADVKAEAADGFVLGDHTQDHIDLVPLTLAQQQYEINTVITEYQELTGQRPVAFRPPNGDYNVYTEKICAADHLAIWEWSVDPADWQYAGTYSAKDVKLIVQSVETQSATMANPVVLFHNPLAGTPDTVAALPTIIQWFQSHGYKFVAL